MQMGEMQLRRRLYIRVGIKWNCVPRDAHKGRLYWWGDIFETRQCTRLYEWVKYYTL